MTAPFGPLVTSTANPLVKRLRLLAQRKHRRREGVTVAHGAQAVRQAVEAGVALETLVIAPDTASPATLDFARAQRAAGVRVVALSTEVFTKLADDVRPSGIAAVVPARSHPLDTLVPATGPATVVALDAVGNPGNLGTVVRTAEATGVDGVVLVGHTADPYDPAAIKASMGAVFTTPVAHAADLDTFFTWARGASLAVATTSGTHAARDLWSAAFPARLALLLGSEGDGLDAPTVARGDLSVRIPMTGTAESLNLAVAAGVLLYERRRTASVASRP